MPQKPSRYLAKLITSFFFFFGRIRQDGTPARNANHNRQLPRELQEPPSVRLLSGEGRDVEVLQGQDLLGRGAEEKVHPHGVERQHQALPLTGLVAATPGCAGCSVGHGGVFVVGGGGCAGWVWGGGLVPGVKLPLVRVATGSGGCGGCGRCGGRGDYCGGRGDGEGCMDGGGYAGCGGRFEGGHRATALMAPAARRAAFAVCVLPLLGDATMVPRIGLEVR